MSIQRVTIPLPIGPPSVNAYLLPAGDEWILIDTGTTHCAELDAALEGKRVCRILLTHLHPDHSGQAPELRARFNAPVAMHPADTRLLHHAKSGSSSPELRDAMRAGGVPPAIVDRVLATYHRLLETFPMLTPDEELLDGAIIPTGLGPMEVVHTPGHAPGHVCFFLRDHGALISGDHVLDRISPHIGWLPGQDALGDFLGSLTRLHALPVRTVLAGHGEPVTNLPDWISRARSHHAVRGAEIERHCARTPAEIVSLLWPRELRPLDYQLAFTEVLAHLAHLGRV